MLRLWGSNFASSRIYEENVSLRVAGYGDCIVKFVMDNFEGDILVDYRVGVDYIVRSVSLG